MVLSVTTAQFRCLFVSQLEEEKRVLLAQRREAEQERLTIRDELVRLEQDRLELDAGRVALQQALQDAEQSRAGPESELQSLRAERLRLQQKVTQVPNRVCYLLVQTSRNRTSLCLHIYQEWTRFIFAFPDVILHLNI